MDEVQFFDQRASYSVAYKNLPHWAQAGALSFITWRTGDSLPAAAERRLSDGRQAAILRAGLDPTGNWREQLRQRPVRVGMRLYGELFAMQDRELNLGFGERLLARPELSQIVLDALLHFDRDRYLLTDAVVMPNHVHVLVAFRHEDAIVTQCSGWKRYSARRINDALGRPGAFWQNEQFDHLVRGPESFERIRRYIADNPRRAGLAAGEFRWYSKGLG